MKCVLISDTHGRHSRLNLPDDIDVLIVSGDFTATRRNSKEDFIDFGYWLRRAPAKHKIFIAGNHDKYLEKNYSEAMDFIHKLNNPPIESNISPANITYLQDSSITIDGVKFYGSPWTPVFFDWYFMASEFNLNRLFNKIEEDTDVLITHGPAKGFLDKTHAGLHVGSESLRYRISELKKLKLHVFGHIHESRGRFERNGVTFINASLAGLNDHYVFYI